MREVFCEETVNNLKVKKQKPIYTIFRILSTTSFLLGLIWFCVALLTLDFNSDGLILVLLFSLVPPILVFLCGILFAFARDKFCVEYDYTFANGKFFFFRVHNRLKSKQIYSFDLDNVERIGVFNDDIYFRYKSIPGVKIDFLTPNDSPEEGKDFYFITTTIKDLKRVLVIEVTKNFILNVRILSKPYLFSEGIK